jgi:hypothetical protein
LPILEVAMQAHADALPRVLERAGEPRWRQAAARPVEERSESDRHEIARDACAPYDPAGVIVVPSAWLAFYAAAATHLL